MWYVGLDWADTHHDVLMLDEAGRRVASRRFAHSHAGLNELKQFLLGIAASPEELACIVETTHGLLITFLLEEGFPVYPMNPKQANQLRKVAGAKTDTIDAQLLAKLGRLDLADLRRLEPDSPTVAELKTLTRDQDALIQRQTRLVNQLTACLKEYYPAALQLFAKVQQRSRLVFLQTYPTPQAAQAASLEELTATLRRCRSRVAITLKRINALPAANRCATSCISSPGCLRDKKAGHGPTTNASVRDAGKATAWPCVPWPMYGCAFSIACG
jgi:transposase